MKKYWFKNRRYGWGWTPITWQGWLVTIIYIITAILGGVFIGENSPILFGIFIIVLVVSLFRICLKKGPKPKCSWGRDK